jgi:hypothetical protein
VAARGEEIKELLAYFVTGHTSYCNGEGVVRA